MPVPEAAVGGSAVEPRATRRVRLTEQCADLPAYAFAALVPGQAISGLAIVESDTTTVFLLDGDLAEMDGRRWLVVTLP